MSNASRSTPGDSGSAFPVYVEAGGKIYPQAARKKLAAAGRKRARGAKAKKRLADRVREQFHARSATGHPSCWLLQTTGF